MSRIQKLQEALEELAEREDDEFTHVCNSGLMLYGEWHNELFEHQKEGVAFLWSRFDSSSETDGAKGDLEEEESDEASEHTEEGPSREMLSLEHKFIGLTVSKPLDSSSQTSIGVPKPLSDEVLVDSPQDKSVEAADDYENLVTRGKELKGCGKIQETLNYFVKALDIKSADPKVMLMTLGLYKQLNNT
ncbi:DNA excision repair protein ERCC-6-like [Sciurus carolinensis]|uniref:DNA excision repair protein ERCC-6-like n=1 Tax=Sciurus carolinensis TaxID=30640 RepID=A0AA41NGL4_SCICA|nr:DNA excision repair protein ERCC-6-like [Sciurus carolinensis]